MNLHEIKEELERRRDEKYREFSLSLTKDSALPMLGVRLPQLRAMAAVIAKEDARGFLESCDFSSMEMTTLYGFVLGRLGELRRALPVVQAGRKAPGRDLGIPDDAPRV